MAAPRSPARKDDRTGVLRAITTPLGFYVLALLIVEATLALVLAGAKLSEEHVWSGFLWMIGVFSGVMVIMTGLTIFAPTKLLFARRNTVRSCSNPPL